MSRSRPLLGVLSMLVLLLWGSPAAAGPDPDPVPAPSPTSSASPAPAPSPGPTESPSPSPSPSPTATATPPADGGLVIATTSDKLVAQVGDQINYRVVVTNTSDFPLIQLSVRDVVPPEITVEGVPIVDSASGMQLGYSPAGEDIVWTFDSLGPGATVELPWFGRAISSGDLTATNLVQAVVRTRAIAESSDLMYLGKTQSTVVRDAPHRTISKEVVRTRTVTKMVPFSTVDASSSSAPAAGTLPATGSDLWLLMMAGVLLIVAGVVLLTSPQPQIAVAFAFVLVVSGACVSDEPTDPIAKAAPRVASGEARRPGTVQDIVLGLRIHNRIETPAGDPAEAGAVVPSDALVPVAVPVEFTDTIEVPLPLEEAASGPGANQVTYDWDADSASISGATSSHLLSSEETVEVMLELELEDGAIHASSTARNVSTDHRVHLAGRLIYEISSASGATTRFESEPVDTVLEPGGQVSADFAHLLPTGSYVATAGFVAN